jgi:hypothetical protein
MAELPDDLNFGVNMEGTVPNVPPARSAEAAPKTDESKAAASSDRFDLKRAGHPVACIATFGFKAAGIFFYLLVGSFISNISTFIIVIILASLDFWVVKNITGRLLVGLRWWSEIDKSGKEQWRFENPREGREVNAVDNAFFWFSQVVGTLVWGILFLLKVLTLGVFWVLFPLCRRCCCSFALPSAGQTSMPTTSAAATTRRS